MENMVWKNTCKLKLSMLSIDNFIYSTESNGDTTIPVDSSGSGRQENSTDVVILEGYAGMDISDLVNDGSVIV